MSQSWLQTSLAHGWAWSPTERRVFLLHPHSSLYRAKYEGIYEANPPDKTNQASPQTSDQNNK